MGLQITGHKYKYVSSQDIVDTDEKYIKELERIAEDYVDYFNWSAYEWHSKLVPEITKLKLENRRLQLELKMIKKFLEEAQRKTNEKWEVK
tara:strand:- start:629 stop:901 length:273 start_codon:yes stop_codon:yes gene_type:complete